MISVNQFLKILEKVGYPNPDTQSIAKMVGYDLGYFLHDLESEIGADGVVDFCDKAIEKISGKNGIRVDLEGPYGDEFVNVHIFPKYYDEGESYNDVISSHGWGDSRILSSDPETGKEGYFTIQEVIDNTDMGGWSELDELLDHIKEKAYNIVYNNCGFGIWWE